MTKQISETLNQGLQFKNKQNAIKENAPKKFKEGFQMSSNTNNKYVPTSYSDPINALDKLEIGNTQDILSTASNAQGQIADIKTLQTQFNTLYNQYITAQNLLLTDTRTNVTNNNNKGSNANLGKNIRTQAGAIGYVTNQGVYKWYDSMDILEDTAGFNQCPGQTWTQLPTNTIPANLTLGSAMVSGQSCGNEGKNVFVSSVIKDPSSTYLGNFNDNSASRAMNLLSQGQVYTYETCQKAAAESGNTLFGLQAVNTTTGLAYCSTSSNLTQTEEYGVAPGKCYAGTDGNQYGTGWTNAIYNTTNSTYVGCYNDSNVRAMIPAMPSSQLYPNPVYVMATANSDSWGNIGFPNNVANFIWYTANADQGAPVVNYGATLFTQYNNTTGAPINAICYSYCDDSAQVYINTAELCDVGMGVEQASCTLNTGMNAIQVVVSNFSGPAGFVMSMYDSNKNILFSTSSAWTYSTTAPPPPSTNGLSQIYSVASCQQAAADYGYTYFAVQDGNAGTSQCFVSNNLTQAEEYGTANSSVAVASATIGGKQYGTSGVNAVYQLTQTGQNTESVGQMGYVDENSNLSVYPTSMLGQGTEYVTLANSNLPGGANIAGDPVTTITSESQCKSACNSTDSCNGYVWGGSGSCWLQSGKNLQQNIATGNIGLANGAITSFQIPSILNSSSCTKDVVKIDSIQWDNYVQNSQDMTPDTTCGLATQIAPEMASVDALEGQLNAVSAKIIAQTSALLKLNSDGSKQIKINDLTLNENLQKYTELNAQFDNTKNKNISGIVSDSNIQIIQNNYSYILWSILAIIAIIITIKLMKK